MTTPRPRPAHRRRNPRGGRPGCGRLPGHGLPRRQRLPPGQPRRPARRRGRRRRARATSPTGPPGASSPAAATRSASSSPSRPAALFSDPFFPRLLRGISASLSARDLQLVLLMPVVARRDAPDGRLPDRRPRRRRAARQPPRRRPAARPDRRRRASRWSSSAGRRGGRRRSSYVDVDNRGGARSAVDHLIAGGRRVIATIAGPPDMAPGVDRLAGYRDALARRRPRRRPEPRGGRATSPRRAARRRWSGSSPPARTSTRSSPPPT